MKVKMMFALAALLTMGLSSAAAHADSVSFSLTSPAGYIPNTGGSYTFNATVSAPTSNGAAVYLNGDSFNLSEPGATVDDSDFFLDAPFSLNPGQSSTFAAFVVTLPANAAFGTYLGSYSLLGGSSGSATDTLGTANFSVTTTPEPSSWALLLTGAAAALLYAGCRRNLAGETL